MKTTYFIEGRIGISTYVHMEEDGLHLSPVVRYSESTSICFDGLDEGDYPAYILRADGVYVAHAPERPMASFTHSLLRSLQNVLYDVMLYDDKTDVWYLYEEYLIQHRPELKYAIEKLRKMSHKPNRAAYTIMMVCFGHVKETESLLSCPHHNNYAWALLEGQLTAPWRHSEDYTFVWDKWTPVQRRHAVRNWYTYEVTVHMGDGVPPMYEWHEPQWDFLMRHINVSGCYPAISRIMDFMRETCGFVFVEKDLKYIQKATSRIYASDTDPCERMQIERLFRTIRLWWDNLRVLQESCEEEAIPRAFADLIQDEYWRYPRDLHAAHDENIMRLETRRSGSTFDKYADKYAAYKIDTVAGGYRFYTSGDERTWQVHATKLSQCVYASKYYEQKGVIVFVEKDGVPYGTIHWCDNRIDEARITQKVYSESEMPQEVQDIFTSQVVPQYEVLQNA